MSREGEELREKILRELHRPVDVGALAQMARNIELLSRSLPMIEQRWFLAERLRDVADQMERCDKLWR
jgi:hypothetical protein